jgi:ABC-type dipeptide/oligopeptide/nickel transport system ATPase component
MCLEVHGIYLKKERRDYPESYGLAPQAGTLREWLRHAFGDRAIAMLEQLNLGDRIDYYPDNLSGGQKLRKKNEG